ncbi:hypothetical protein [Candidatus Rhabdochlamydia sp. T3358]|uniref:hypothetical protein n=1 Tax=Candidatus Rhabdochlamydia sp. T3358 TaxID=2099795 RepID=UPI0010B921BA|nr:hypothetical protein [Candidatus Rhabdochlamydia sp. T3358]VHO02871.1 hypothetical protein RHT_00703 [Candidatus Rhabdochlamydia sp. T3358]
MIKEVIHDYYNKSAEAGFNIINENALIQKVKEISENIIFSIGAQTFIGSLALKACGISFGTSFPILLALVVAKSFITTLNHVKTVIKATLNGAKTLIKITAQKAASPFMRIAEVINDIFKRVCASFMSFAISSYHLMKDITYSSNFREFNSTPIVPHVNEEPIETQELTIEEEPSVAEDLALSKPRLPLCDSQFIIKEKDTKEGLLLRGMPESLYQNLERQVLEKHCQGSLMRLLLKDDNTPWVFFLEHSPDRPLKEPTPQRLGTSIKTLKNIPERFLFEGIPVALRSNL